MYKTVILWFCPSCQECGGILYSGVGEVRDNNLIETEIKKNHNLISKKCETKITDIISEKRMSVSEEEVSILLDDFLKTRTGQFIVEWNCWNCSCGDLKPHYFQTDELNTETILREIKTIKQKRSGCCLNENSYINFIVKNNKQFLSNYSVLTFCQGH